MKLKSSICLGFCKYNSHFRWILLLLFHNMPLICCGQLHQNTNSFVKNLEFIHIFSYYSFLIFKFYSEFFEFYFRKYFNSYFIILFLLLFTAL